MVIIIITIVIITISVITKTTFSAIDRFSRSSLFSAASYLKMIKSFWQFLVLLGWCWWRSRWWSRWRWLRHDSPPPSSALSPPSHRVRAKYTTWENKFHQLGNISRWETKSLEWPMISKGNNSICLCFNLVFFSICFNLVFFSICFNLVFFGLRESHRALLLIISHN